ncbi:hypothetical protein [Bacillus sp. FSL W8-0848]|nr:hypothetical protein TH62_20175 [Bacillus sp. TH008]
MTETKKYVRILKAPNKSSWYANKIGQVFEVDREGYTYLIRKGPHHLTAIRKEDAELIVTEKRPAKVGDKVLILDDFNEPRYMLHDVVPVIGGVDEHGVAVRKSGEWPIFLNNEQYEVIVNNEVKNEEADEMERYDTAVETARDAIEELRLAAYAKGYEDARRDLLAQAPVGNGAQERRDEIVEQAKADIAKLAPNGVIKRPIGECDAEFIVNRNKRTVVVLIKGRYSGRVYVKGIAKAAPDDCFNEHIGKAIALHRALGIEVPDEYLNAPQPTEVRVGDVVGSFEFNEVADYYGKIVDVSEDKVFYEDGGFDYLPTVTEGIDEDGEDSFLKIIDDSRMEVGE